MLRRDAEPARPVGGLGTEMLRLAQPQTAEPEKPKPDSGGYNVPRTQGAGCSTLRASVTHGRRGYTHGHMLAHAGCTQASTGPEVPSQARTTPRVPHTPGGARPPRPPAPPAPPRALRHLPMKLMASGKNWERFWLQWSEMGICL